VGGGGRGAGDWDIGRDGRQEVRKESGWEGGRRGEEIVAEEYRIDP